jgi:RNA recognition motif-containing protein
MGNKLYVGNLNFSVSSNDLKQIFEEHGPVTDAMVVTDRESGRSRGFGFVQLESSEAANAAIDAVDGTEHEGRKLVVNVAKPPRVNKSAVGGGGRPY